MEIKREILQEIIDSAYIYINDICTSYENREEINDVMITLNQRVRHDKDKILVIGIKGEN